MYIYRTIKNGGETKHHLYVSKEGGKIYGFLQLNPEDEWDEDDVFFNKCCECLKRIYGGFRKFELYHKMI